MQREQLLEQLQRSLMPLADADRAAGMRAYMRDRFDFMGIATPLRRATTRPLLRGLRGAPGEVMLECARDLWALPEREYQYVAVDLLAMHWRSLALMPLGDSSAALLALAQQKSWWDSVDGLAGVVGDVMLSACAQDGKAQIAMDAALAHPDMWVRRIAMLHQLGWRGDTDTQRLFGYALQLAPETDFFIRKAIGWALRDYARHAPQAVGQFLGEHGAKLSPLSVREAAKHLSLTGL